MGFAVAGIFVGTPESLLLETKNLNPNVPDHMHRHIGIYRYIDANIQFSTVQDSTIQCNALRYVTSPYITLHCIVLRYITYIQYITSYQITYITLPYIIYLCLHYVYYKPFSDVFLKNHQSISGSPTKSNQAEYLRRVLLHNPTKNL